MNSSDLDSIGEHYRDDPDKCLREVIKCWLRCCYKPTWSKIITALRAPSVEFLDLARSIHASHFEESETEEDYTSSQVTHNETFHCPCGGCSLESYLDKGCHSSSNLFPYLDIKNLAEDTKDDLIQRLTNDLADIMTCFAELLDKTTVSIGRCKEPETIDILISRALSLGAFDHPHIQKPLLSDDKRELECSKTVYAAFIVLRRHMSFFNFELLQHIIKSEELCTNEDRKQMKEYCNKFDQFCRHKVFEVPPDVYGQHRSDCKRKSFVVLMTRYEEEKNLIFVRAARHKIATLLNLKVSTLHLHRIDEGSLILVFSVPEFVAQFLFPLDDSLEASLIHEGYTIFSTISSEYCLFKDKDIMPVTTLKEESIAKNHTSPTPPFEESPAPENRVIREQLNNNITPAEYPYSKKMLMVHSL